MRGSVTAVSKRLGRIVGTLVLAVAVAVLLGLGLGPRTGIYRTLTVYTGSMSPSYPAGAIVVQTPIAVEDVEVGDVITYRIPVEDRRVVTHRVVEIVEEGDSPIVITQGDANEERDAWTARLTGGETWKTRFGVPGVGTVLDTLGSPLARRVTTIALPAVLALLWLADIWRTPRSQLEPDEAVPA